MSMIKIEGLTFAYPGSYDNIFENVSLQIDTDWRLGLIGRNGRGKTTFLRLLLGEYEYGGSISAAVRFAYFPYAPEDKSGLTIEVLQAASPEAEEWQLARELAYLDMGEETLWQPFATLSGGEQTKALLAAFFLRDNCFLLIDEPTNHLDAQGRARLAAYLRQKRGYILVSHDRRFLDGCVSHILSLNRADIELQSGNFSSWYANFTRQQQFEQAQNERLQKDIKRLRRAAGRTAVWSDKVEKTKISGTKADRGYIGHKSAKMMKRAKAIAAREQQAIEQKSSLLQNREQAEDLKLFPLPYRAEMLAELREVCVAYDGKTVCGPLSFAVHRGERLAMTGGNGSGKTSLLKLLVGCDMAHSGSVSVGSGLRISYVPQDAGGLRGDLAAFARQSGLDETQFFTILRKFGFARTQFDKDMCELSAGQKKKVLLAKSLCEQAHLYVWDEPLNYIDIYSRMQLADLIKKFAPTMVFVEHDAAFCDAVATGRVQL